MSELLKEFTEYNKCLDHLTTLYMKYSSILHEEFRIKYTHNIKYLIENLDDQKVELLEKITICCQDIQNHVLRILELLENQILIDLDEINELNRIHIDSMNSYRYCITKAKTFKDDSNIQNSVKILKSCKERLQHNIECYNKFLVESFYNNLLLTPNKAIKLSIDEEKDILKDL